eukprot:TRINITY_DN6361_c1_g1_i1.p1 TRINITY_DN6361_c1_g1~~TRINITY_DN6361_c1_g1_i1.p1  ORF type:complete len:828 (+),score=94.76 TRINITY_DN6361_c1_g1_i1:64-2547(+)
MRLFRIPFVLAVVALKTLLLGAACMNAYRIRMYAIQTYGYVIHEFDPWFNYRATEYLAEHGYRTFFKWYDYMSWYPIGRPVGTTIYPGMQIASVAIWEGLKHVPEKTVKIPKQYWKDIPTWLAAYLPNKGRSLHFGPMSLNDVCCMVPAWFGSLATLLIFFFTWEVSGSSGAGIVAAWIMAIIPAHIMRSVAGGFDNESVAVSAFLLAFWLWCRCVRTPRSWPFAILAGFAYAFAASAWGGYIFVNNMIGLHTAVTVALGKYTDGLYKAYTIWFLVGTYGAMAVPVIGWAPLRSLEQMPSLLVFVVLQVMHLCDLYRRKQKKDMSGFRFFFVRAFAFILVASVCAVGCTILMQLGYFMPLGARIRGLFLEAVKTGNPLVDSVAEHQPANDQAFDSYLGKPRFLAVFGLLFIWHQDSPGKFLCFVYAAVAYHYSTKMSRLVLICGPIVSCLAGIPLGLLGDWCVEQIVGLVGRPRPATVEAPLPPRTGGMGSIYRFVWRSLGPCLWPAEIADAVQSKENFRERWWFVDRPTRAVVSVVIALTIFRNLKDPWAEFSRNSHMVAQQMSSPQLMFETRLNNGQKIIVDDYIRGYEWMKKNTPEDSRVMAWWDYGYQITGVSNRTSIADGNTWNHEHIATLGRILTSTEKRCHNAMRHLADYALVWAGGHGDDMGKSPHLARIGNSVFPDHCGDDDPLCSKFSFYQNGEPTPMMASSFLYKAVNHNVKDGVRLNSKLWKEVHTTKYGLMRIFKVMNISQESKDWVADPKNRVCDAPGSWYCVGQYPPALAPLIAKRRNFAQLEDFNKKGEKSAYTKMIEKQRTSKTKDPNDD